MRLRWFAILSLVGVALSCNGGGAEPVDPTALFDGWASLARSAEEQGTIAVEGADGWLFLSTELRHLGAGPFWGERAADASRARRPEWADPLPAILDFHEQLREVGVELLLVPVPPKGIIYPDELPSAIELDDETPPRLDVHHQAFYEILRENGVDVLDLTPHFLSHREHERGSLYCRQDTHWSGAGVVLAAERIAGAVRSRPWFEAPERNLESEWRSVTIRGDLWSALDEPRPPRESVALRFVGPVEVDRASPVVLLGDSHTLVFHAGGDLHAEGAGLPDQLAYELGFAVDLVGVLGSGATAARINLLRRAQRTPDYWAGKRLVIWCFSARELTESDGWRTVPIR